MTQWRKSSRSGSSGSCVEVRHDAAAVEVRDSKDQAGPVLTFGTDAWRALVAAIRAGRL